MSTVCSLDWNKIYESGVAQE